MNSLLDVIRGYEGNQVISLSTNYKEPNITHLALLTKLISILGPTNSGSNIVHQKPFSASILSFFQLNICYCHQDLH